MQRRIWVKLPSFPEEFSQALFFAKLESNPVVFEPELLGKTIDRVSNLSVLQVSQDCQHRRSQRTLTNRDFAHLNSPFILFPQNRSLSTASTLSALLRLGGVPASVYKTLPVLWS